MSVKKNYKCTKVTRSQKEVLTLIPKKSMRSSKINVDWIESTMVILDRFNLR